MPFKYNPHSGALDYYTTLTGAEIVTLLEALGGGSRLSHTKLDDIGATDHHAQLHAAEHVTGGDDVVANAVPAGNAGLMIGADKTKLDAITITAGKTLAIEDVSLIDQDLTKDSETVEFAKLGIGTATPNDEVEIYAADDTAKLRISGLNNAANGFQLGFLDATNVAITNTENGYILFGTSGAEQMRIGASGNISAKHIYPYVTNTQVLGSDSLAWKRLHYHSLVDETCAYMGDYSIEALYQMFKQIRPVKDGTLHYAEGSDKYYPHTDFATLPDEFSWKATEHLFKELPINRGKGKKIRLYAAGEKSSIDRTVQGDALIALVVKMYEKNQDLTQRMEALEDGR